MGRELVPAQDIDNTHMIRCADLGACGSNKGRDGLRALPIMAAAAESPAVASPKRASAEASEDAHSTHQRSILYGSVATPIKKPESDHTHRWTVYVRGFHEEDISKYIKRVVFRLHESFPNPSRSKLTPPFV